MQMPARSLGMQRKTDWHILEADSPGTSPLQRWHPLTHQIVLYTETMQAFKIAFRCDLWVTKKKRKKKKLCGFLLSGVELIYCRLLKCFKSRSGFRFNIYVWVAMSSKLFRGLKGCICVVSGFCTVKARTVFSPINDTCSSDLLCVRIQCQFLLSSTPVRHIHNEYLLKHLF